MEKESQTKNINYVRFDISMSGLPVKGKCFSCVQSLPLAFYEILNN